MKPIKVLELSEVDRLKIDYETTDSLFYCTNMALASVGTNLFVNYSSYL